MGVHRFRHLGGSPRPPTKNMHGIPSDRLGARDPWKKPGTRFIALPIAPQQGQQFGGQHDKAVALAFALLHLEHHPRTVDVWHTQLAECRDSEACGIER